MADQYIFGRIYCLDDVLETNQPGSRYILCEKYDRDHVIHFGRKRRFKVPAECYTLILLSHDYILERIPFDEHGECDYLKELDKQGIEYSIPAKLPPSYRKEFTRFQVAIGDVYGMGTTRAYLGNNGYAITDIGYIGDDRYTEFEIKLREGLGSMKIKDHKIVGIHGFDIPNEPFIKRILTEDVHVEDGEPLLELVREAGLSDSSDYLRFEEQME